MPQFASFALSVILLATGAFLVDPDLADWQTQWRLAVGILLMVAAYHAVCSALKGTPKARLAEAADVINDAWAELVTDESAPHKPNEPEVIPVVDWQPPAVVSHTDSGLSHEDLHRDAGPAIVAGCECGQCMDRRGAAIQHGETPLYHGSFVGCECEECVAHREAA